MIHPSPRWRFVQEIEDQGYYEDDLVQHHVTELRAIRRSFSDKFTADEIAENEVRIQLRLAASCNPPALPLVYAAEVVKGRLTFIIESVEGMDVAHHILHKEYTKARPWAAFAMKLTEELLQLRRANARIDRLPLEHLVLTESDEFRITRRMPVGIIDPALLEKSRFLQRFNINQLGGVYTSTAPPDEGRELANVRDLLVKAASASPASTFEELRQEAIAAPDRHPSQIARVDSVICDFLFRINTGRGSADITTLDQLHSRLAAFHEELVNQAQAERDRIAAAMRETPASKTAAPIKAPRIAAIARVDPDENPFLPKVGQESAPQQRPASRASSSGESPMPATGAPAPASRPPKPAIVAEIPEDSNPFAAGAPPSSPGVAAPPMPVAAPAPQSASALAVPRAPKAAMPPELIKKIVLAVVVIGLIAAAAVVVPSLMNRQPRDTIKPVAAVADGLDRAAAANAKVYFDASQSNDNMAKALTYQWTLLSPKGAKVLVGDAEGGPVSERSSYSTLASKIFMQFLEPGAYEVELRVNDGVLYSEPVIVHIAATR